MTIDQDKLRDVRERFIISQMSKLEPNRRKSLAANWEWTRLKLELNRLRLARGEAPIDPDDHEEAAYEAMKARNGRSE